jgi:type IX secretion system PorP/SprF family membrane protein
MKQFKNITIMVLFFFLIGNTGIQAQQDSQYTQYMYNTVMFNPAYAGSREKLSVTSLYRAQWIGLEGAPKTINFGIESPLGSGIGLAINIINDKIGPSNQTNAAANLSYYIGLGENYKLYFGIRGAVSLLNVDFTKLNIENTQDPALAANIDNRFSPNIGAGLYLQSDNAYLGISIPSFLETKYYKDSQTSMAKEKQHIYFMTGYVFDLSYNLKLKPAALVKVVTSSPTQVDLSANFLYNEKFTLGIGYRLNTAVSALAAFQVYDKILIGYAYDRNTSRLGQYASGSHELFLQFDLNNYTKTNRANFRFF